MSYEHGMHAPHGAQQADDDLWTDLAEIPDNAYEDDTPDGDAQTDD